MQVVLDFQGWRQGFCELEESVLEGFLDCLGRGLFGGCVGYVVDVLAVFYQHAVLGQEEYLEHGMHVLAVLLQIRNNLLHNIIPLLIQIKHTNKHPPLAQLNKLLKIALILALIIKKRHKLDALPQSIDPRFQDLHKFLHMLFLSFDEPEIFWGALLAGCCRDFELVFEV